MRKHGMMNPKDIQKHITEPLVNAEGKPLTREQIIQSVRRISSWIDSEDTQVSDYIGGQAQAKIRLEAVRPQIYAQTRNHIDGAVTKLSPYISRGVISSETVVQKALSVESPKTAEKFIQQIAWREYWQGILSHNPQWLWEDAEAYKTGFVASDYVDDLPADIAKAQTGVACIDYFLEELITNGWVHNHGRLYLAAYICHWRRVKWQVGAKFFLSHLLDADPASNNLSWQWVASTFSHKPYYFNLENVQKFSGNDIDTSPEANAVLDASYEDLAAKLFPNLEAG